MVAAGKEEASTSIKYIYHLKWLSKILWKLLIDRMPRRTGLGYVINSKKGAKLGLVGQDIQYLICEEGTGVIF